MPIAADLVWRRNPRNAAPDKSVGLRPIANPGYAKVAFAGSRIASMGLKMGANPALIAADRVQSSVRDPHRNYAEPYLRVMTTPRRSVLQKVRRDISRSNMSRRLMNSTFVGKPFAAPGAAREEYLS